MRRGIRLPAAASLRRHSIPARSILRTGCYRARHIISHPKRRSTATYSTDAKSGGVNLVTGPPAGVPYTVKPEHADNYDIGVKNELFNALDMHYITQDQLLVINATGAHGAKVGDPLMFGAVDGLRTEAGDAAG